MESEELSTDRTKVRRSRDELQGTRDEHEGEDTSPVKGVASATGSPRVDFGRQGLREALNRGRPPTGTYMVVFWTGSR